MSDPVPRLLRGLRHQYFCEVAADIPWRFLTRSKRGITSRSPDSKYETMTLLDAAALPVSAYVARNARLWFWVTGPFLAIGAHVPIMRAWGFEPVAIAFVWVKPVQSRWENGGGDPNTYFKMNQGFTTRQNAEYVVLGNRGKPPQRLSAAVRQVIVEPAREHSRKPERFYQRLEQYSDGPFLELFGRTPRLNWTVRGDQLGMF